MRSGVQFSNAAGGSNLKCRFHFFRVRAGIEQAISRGLSYAPYCDLIWCETSHPDLAEARRFAAGIHAQFPGMMLNYNCSPSFNWKAKLDEATIAKFRSELFAMDFGRSRSRTISRRAA